jgi:nicotinate-nucleotide adenylyltransferase
MPRPVPDRPRAAAGQVVGLLGGSFDPPHEGHVAITRAALARFGVDRVWWLVSPGNPLKSRGPAPLDLRLAAARALIRHPRVSVTGIEAQLGTRYTARTLAALQRRYPQVRFVWLMGADNLAGFHHWQDWRGIARRVPIGVLARPGLPAPAGLSPAARTLAGARVQPGRALGRARAPAWTFLMLPLNETSSTAIRARGGWGRAGR